MLHSNRFSVTEAGIVVVVTIAFLFVGCKRSNEEVAVNVLRENKSAFFEQHEHKLLRFQQSRPKTASGRYIIIASVLPSHGDFKKILSEDSRLSNLKPDLVILSSSDQRTLGPIVAAESSNSTNLCNDSSDCPAFIPSWVNGDKLEATKQVLRVLSIK
jgi:hypothetical protein